MSLAFGDARCKFVENLNVMRFSTFCLISLLNLCILNASAQNVKILPPASPLSFCDKTNNDPAKWNKSTYWDAANETHDLCETSIKLTAKAIAKNCMGLLKWKFKLKLDLISNRSVYQFFRFFFEQT